MASAVYSALAGAFTSVYPFASPAHLSSLYYYDRFGAFSIVDKITEDYKYTGKFPITSSGGTTGVLELIHFMSNNGLWVGPKERESIYRRCLGWSLYRNSDLPTDIQINHQFQNFHKLIQLTVRFFNKQDIATAIKGSQSSNAPASLATESSIRNTCKLLKSSFTIFTYGRNQINTYLGLLGLSLGLALTTNIKEIIGIPSSYSELSQVMNAAHNILITKKPITHSGSNRFQVHDQLALRSQRILEQISLFDFNATDPPLPPNNTTLLSVWLQNIQQDVEAYRTNYRTLTSVDLGALDSTTSLPQVSPVVV